MKRLLTSVAVMALVIGPAAAALAQPHDDRHDDRRDDHPQHNWRKGGRIEHGDWDRGAHLDWRAHHLRAPPRGYEWREVDGNYVLAAAATGLIASVIAASR